MKQKDKMLMFNNENIKKMKMTSYLNIDIMLIKMDYSVSR